MARSIVTLDCQRAYTSFCAAKVEGRKLVLQWTAFEERMDELIMERKDEFYTLNAENVELVKLEPLKRDIKELERERVDTAIQYKEAWVNLRTDSAILYSQAWNLEFALKMKKKLPAEVRAMVYTSLLEDTTNTHKKALWHVSHSPKCAAHMCNHEQKHDLPHFIDPEYVGVNMAYDTIKAWYKARGSPGHRIYGAHNIKNFLCSNVFRLGVDPTTAVRSLTIYIWVDVPAVNRGSFSDLLKIKNRHNLVINVEVIQRSANIRPVGDMIQSLSHVYNTLRKDGAIVTVNWKYVGNWDLHIRLKQIMDNRMGARKEDTDYSDFTVAKWGAHLDDFFTKGLQIRFMLFSSICLRNLTDD